MEIAAGTVKGKGGGVPLDVWNGSRATKELQATIERIERENARQQKWMLWLTAIAAIAAVIAAWPVVWGWVH